MQGAVKLDTQSLKALKDIFLFWFPLIWSFTILISLFRAIKFIFNKQLNGYAFKLLRCQTKSVIEDISYADLVKPFRKWLMLMIWLVGSLMIVSLISTNLFSGYDSVFEWFNIYYLYFFILISGYFSFVLIAGRCKNIRVVRC
jgi:hypothetical protein